MTFIVKGNGKMVRIDGLNGLRGKVMMTCSLKGLNGNVMMTCSLNGLNGNVMMTVMMTCSLNGLMISNGMKVSNPLFTNAISGTL